MLFKPHHVELIKAGEKTATRRAWKRRMVRVGGVYPVQTKMFQPKSECELFIRVAKVYRQRLGYMSMVDYVKEGGYKGKEEFRRVWEEINGAGSWDDNLEVWVVEFVVERKPGKCAT